MSTGAFWGFQRVKKSNRTPISCCTETHRKKGSFMWNRCNVYKYIWPYIRPYKCVFFAAACFCLGCIQHLLLFLITHKGVAAPLHYIMLRWHTQSHGALNPQFDCKVSANSALLRIIHSQIRCEQKQLYYKKSIRACGGWIAKWTWIHLAKYSVSDAECYMMQFFCS